VRTVVILDISDVDNVLDYIAVIFTTLINVDALFCYLSSHHLLTNHEASICQSSLYSPSQKAQNLLTFLRSKGSDVLQKLLCCLNKASAHSGHKDVATKLKEAIKLYKVINLPCSVCSTTKQDAMTDGT